MIWNRSPQEQWSLSLMILCPRFAAKGATQTNQTQPAPITKAPRSRARRETFVARHPQANTAGPVAHVRCAALADLPVGCVADQRRSAFHPRHQEVG